MRCVILACPSVLMSNLVYVLFTQALLAAGEAKRARLMAQALASQCPSNGQLQLLLSSACLGIPGATDDAVRHARQPHLPSVWCWKLFSSQVPSCLGAIRVLKYAAQRCSLLSKACAEGSKGSCLSLNHWQGRASLACRARQRAQPGARRGDIQALLSQRFHCLSSSASVGGSRAALETAGQPGGPSEAAAQLALGAALGASAAPGLGLPAAAAAQREALVALQAAVALAPDDPAELYSLGLMQVIPLQY